MVWFADVVVTGLDSVRTGFIIACDLDTCVGCEYLCCVGVGGAVIDCDEYAGSMCIW